MVTYVADYIILPFPHEDSVGTWRLCCFGSERNLMKIANPFFRKSGFHSDVVFI